MHGFKPDHVNVSCHKFPFGHPICMTKDTVLNEYGDLFKGIGVIQGKCHLHLKDEAMQVMCAPRRIPDALKTKVMSELDRMEKDGIIAKVTELTYLVLYLW